MANAPRARSIGRDAIPDAPAWWDRVVTALTPFFGDISSALDKQLNRDNLLRGDSTAIKFTTKASVDDTWPVLVKNSLPFRPSHLVVTDLEKTDGTNPSAAWSHTWKLSQSGAIELRFQGLEASTEYRIAIIYE